MFEYLKSLFVSIPVPPPMPPPIPPVLPPMTRTSYPIVIPKRERFLYC